MENNTVWTLSQKAAWKMPGLMKGIDAYTEDEQSAHIMSTAKSHL